MISLTSLLSSVQQVVRAVSDLEKLRLIVPYGVLLDVVLPGLEPWFAAPLSAVPNAFLHCAHQADGQPQLLRTPCNRHTSTLAMRAHSLDDIDYVQLDGRFSILLTTAVPASQRIRLR